MEFDAKERQILAKFQGNIPDSLTPFADIAREVGASEEEVLGLLRQLRTTGAIRRFGASLRHQNAGWKANAMVAWAADRATADRCGQLCSQNSHVSHAYYRPSTHPDFPWSFYTMVHGRDAEECRNVIASLAEELGLRDYAILKTRRELKKTSMTYFG